MDNKALEVSRLDNMRLAVGGALENKIPDVEDERINKTSIIKSHYVYKEDEIWLILQTYILSSSNNPPEAKTELTRDKSMPGNTGKGRKNIF